MLEEGCSHGGGQFKHHGFFIEHAGFHVAGFLQAQSGLVVQQFGKSISARIPTFQPENVVFSVGSNVELPGEVLAKVSLRQLHPSW